MIKHIFFFIVVAICFQFAQADTCSTDATVNIGERVILSCIPNNNEAAIYLMSYNEVCTTYKRALNRTRTYYTHQEGYMASLDAEEKEIETFLSDRNNCVFLITQLSANEHKIIMNVGSKEIYPEIIAANSLLATYLDLLNKNGSILSFKLPVNSNSKSGRLSFDNKCCVAVNFLKDK